MDALRNQIIERKVIELIEEHAKFKDVKYEPESNETVPFDLALAARRVRDSIRPSTEAKSKPLQQPVDRT